MGPELPDELNLAEWFLARRVSEGRGSRRALVTRERTWTYAEVLTATHRFASLYAELGLAPEQRVLVALPDIPEFAPALFGALHAGGVGVMLSCHLRLDEVEYFMEYTRARLCVVHEEHAGVFREAAARARHLVHLIVLGGRGDARRGQVHEHAAEGRLQRAGREHPLFPSHKDDAAIWLFSGGTTGRPKAAVQSHASFVNTTVLYAQRTLGYREDDLTLSVPKLYFGYATGANLLFPFSVGAAAVLFPERVTADVLFEQIARHRPTILINVPTMVAHLVAHPSAAEQDLSCLRFATSAGEALPVELYDRWRARFGVELLDGLGTAEMWHVFLTNRPGDVKPGTLGRVVEGFELKVADDEGRELPRGETGWLWVKGRSRANSYWQLLDKTMSAFRGEWYVSGDMIAMDGDGYVTYAGRGDDMLKVGGKWLAPAEVENCLLAHEWVAEAAVVGVSDAQGLVKPHAHVVLRAGAPQGSDVGEVLRAFVAAQLEPYKAPRAVRVHESLPKTHLGKVDRGALRRA